MALLSKSSPKKSPAASKPATSHADFTGVMMEPSGRLKAGARLDMMQDTMADAFRLTGEMMMMTFIT